MARGTYEHFSSGFSLTLAPCSANLHPPLLCITTSPHLDDIILPPLAQLLFFPTASAGSSLSNATSHITNAGQRRPNVFSGARLSNPHGYSIQSMRRGPRSYTDYLAGLRYLPQPSSTRTTTTKPLPHPYLHGAPADCHQELGSEASTLWVSNSSPFCCRYQCVVCRFDRENVIYTSTPLQLVAIFWQWAVALNFVRLPRTNILTPHRGCLPRGFQSLHPQMVVEPRHTGLRGDLGHMQISVNPRPPEERICVRL